MFEEIVKKPASWLAGDGTQSGIVLSSRIRLARNISGCSFSSVSNAENLERIISFVRLAIQKSPNLKTGQFLLWNEVPDLDRTLLMERHLVSPEFMRGTDSRALFVSQEEIVSIMVNEEDHLRIQVIQSGLEIRDTYCIADKIDDDLGQSLQFDFDPDFGFLTACPTNVGTGMRASILIHLPGLVLTREIEKVISQITKVGLTVRGFYGEGTDVLGNLFQISNQTSLGRSEEDIIESLEKVTKQIIEYETNSRTTLFEDAREQIEDKIWRAYGILKNARSLTSEEVMNLLSAIRLGLSMGSIDLLSLPTINEVLILSQPAHLQKYFEKDMDSTERDIRRAELVRAKLANCS